MKTKTKNALNGDVVESLFISLLFQKDEIKDGKPIIAPKIGEGIITKHFGFFPERIESKREEIKEMLLELPNEFMQSGGGGWSFLNACLTKDGIQWTDFHERMEQLFAMGNALGLSEYMMPREMWAYLPGGMPYIVVKDKTF